MSAAERWVGCVLLLLPALGWAQVELEGAPAVVKKPATKEQLDRRDAATLYGIGIQQRRNDKLFEALQTLEKAARLDPDSFEVRKALIPIYMSVGREEQALRLAKSVLERDPTEAETAFQCSRLLKAEGKPGEAADVLQRALVGKEIPPDRALIMFSDLFELLERQGKYADAAETQERLIKSLTSHRDQLLHTFGREDLQSSLVRAHERMGKCFVQIKEFAKAAKAYRAARDAALEFQDPDMRNQAIRFNWNVCEMMVAQKLWPEALEALDAYLAFAPQETEPYEKRGEILREMGREQEVIPSLRKLANRDQYNLGLHLLLARELTRSPATRREAERFYLTILKGSIKPEIYTGLFKLYVIEHRMGQVIEILDSHVRVLNADEKEQTEKVEDRESARERLRAILVVLRAHPEMVRELLNAWRLGDKRHPQSWMLLASLAARAKQLDRAEALFRESLRTVGPALEANAYMGLIEVLFKQRKYQQVVEVCRGAIDRPAKNTNAALFQSSLASAYTALGKYDEAIKAVDEAIKLTSEEAKARQRQHRAKILAHAGRYQEGVTECLETMKEFDRPAILRETRIALSVVYSLQEDHAKAEQQLRLILEADPDHPLANNNLGYQMADRNINLDEAEKLIRHAIEEDKSIRKDAEEEEENASYLDSLGWVLFRKGKLDEAKTWLEKAASLSEGEEDPTVWDHLGDVYFKLNQPARAKEAWQSAIRLYTAGSDPKKTSRLQEIEKKIKQAS
jgi:tetratricopeptide (TPR) repeat protein